MSMPRRGQGDGPSLLLKGHGLTRNLKALEEATRATTGSRFDAAGQAENQDQKALAEAAGDQAAFAGMPSQN